MLKQLPFIEQIRAELIKDGTPKMLLDYIDERIKQVIDQELPNYFDALRTQLKEEQDR